MSQALTLLMPADGFLLKVPVPFGSRQAGQTGVLGYLQATFKPVVTVNKPAEE